MITSKVTSKAQTTIPKKVREKLDIHVNDTIMFEIKEDYAIIRKLKVVDTGYLKALETILEEWNSEEDSVYDDL
ncbi:MAG: AbrB/MazE/SpoVT family DNA-binding domain-containing protein [Candidatus Marinimicrobia bacterium]|nr:AbrB/MazE/SpoVT family DNA-binding domain-containing protein [Candidatus Neomarinimicrobiota bacterium]MCH7763908.1 AbrB/MazE/SpoVT family DNA-binding domain-containing protein [Candidatus Neomarinimicrobiota bacterium]